MCSKDKEQIDAGQPLRLPWWGRAMRAVLVPSFWIFNRTFLNVHVRGLENCTNNPATILAANHKSDFDTVVLVPSFYYAARGKGAISKMRFVAAEQMFEPGYVSMYLLKSKWRFFRKLLYPANMSALLQGGGAHPIAGSRNRKLNRHLRIVQEQLGDIALDSVLEENPQLVFPGAKKGATVSSILRWRYSEILDKPCGVSKFTAPIAGELRRAHVQELEDNLHYFARQLDSGASVYIAPEGRISAEGKFKGIRAGLDRLIRAAQNPITLLPINFTYDSLTYRRATVFMNVGEQLLNAQTCQRDDLEKLMSKRIAALSTITLPQLVAKEGEQEFAQGKFVIEESNLKSATRGRAAKLAAQGFYVDNNLLDENKFNRQFAGFMKNCQKRRLAVKEAEKIIFPAKPRARNSSDRIWWRYALNEYSAAIGG